MEKPKIAVFIDQLVLGGVQKDAIEEVKTLRKLGYEAELVVLMRRGFKPAFKRYVNKIPYQFLSDRYPRPLRYSFKFPIFSFFSLLHLTSPFLTPLFVKKSEWDIIVAHGTTTCLTTFSLTRTKNIKYLAIIHDPMEYILKQVYKETFLKTFFGILSPLLYFIEKIIVNNAQKTFVVSTVHSHFIEKTYNIKPYILTAGATPLIRLPKKRHNFLLAASRWEKGKNPFLLLRILKKIPQTKLVIAGSWTKNADLIWFKKQTEIFGLTKRVEIISPVSDKKLQTLYSQALVWIHPHFEAFGVGGLEAAAHGCPIIIPKGSGVSELFQDKKDGFFPKKATLSGFLQPLKFLVNNPQKAYEMGMSAHKRAKIYSWKNHTQNLLTQIIASKIPNQKNIIVLETGHSSEAYLAGGDRLLEKMANYFPSNFKLNIIIPVIGKKHWLESKLRNFKLTILKPTIFDNNPIPSWVFIAYLIRIWQTYWQLRKLKNIDIIYSSTNVLPDVIPAYIFKLTHPNIPWIARIHHLINSPTKRPGKLSVNIVSYMMQTLSNHLIKNKSTLTLCLNNQLLKSLASQQFTKEKLKILGAGIDYQKIRKTKSASNKLYDAIFVGRIHPSKGIFDIIDIWGKVVTKKPKAKVLVVGSGSKEENRRLISQIASSKLQKNILIAGYLPEDKLYASLKSSKIFLFTDYEAGWGLAIGEAMAAGLPVIGYNLDVFGDIFKQGFLTAPLGNTELFANKIIDLMYNESHYQKFSKEALIQAQQLSWQETSYKFQSIINKIKND